MKALSLIVCSILATSGCANSMHDSLWIKSKYAEDYQLNSSCYSEATRFFYATTWNKPSRNRNNLDEFHDDIPSSPVASVGQVSSVIGAVTGSLSLLTAASSIVSLEGSKTQYSQFMGRTVLFTIKTFDKDKDWQSQSDGLNQLSLKTVSSALGSNAVIAKNITEYYTLKQWYIHDSSNPHCRGTKPDDMSNLCYSYMANTPLIDWDNDGYIPWLPKGDVITSAVGLAPGFPIEKIKPLKNKGVEQYLYVPPLRLSTVLALFLKKNLSDTTKWYKLNRLSINPYIKRLSDGEIIYFNPSITAKQKDKHSLYKTFHLSP
ncbi:hypothetical protein L4C34_04630 [Vibrio profundum]|uniref:hypothetical protein n=1 Tax=Vibrio profundum TaxID=2910247 RepID=UPI003D13A2C9